MYYLVEIIRYGDPALGVQLFGVYDDFNRIRPTMDEYNNYRGGKYPSYFVQGIELNPEDIVIHDRVRYDL